MESPEAVFVYGTLKQGERNFEVSRLAGWLRSEPAYIEGFRLFHIPEGDLRPYGYPGVVKGEGRVWGEVQWFADLAQALVLLDRLEDEGSEYLRSPITAYLSEQGGAPRTVWVYTYPSLQAVESVGGIWLPEGVWGEQMQPKG
ncbi:MAG: gamma-glutamylcyclotransferase [Meiothermus sp.]|uniref:gamma-glutamylcyclotransferase family protein n=1 Tax=Meiothermus sp. TaxID=1955249 RepID=UPI0025FD0DC7|nr:gamma-glutamylcyclotransferase family protein [Meiothermus sp.]MCS7068120.1 gamma-glutamylcyclotransferase [Meiothermus sp.]MCX7601741.1 gamma-glutamylcyclotransferase [Meiothermus sp.]MDW8426300.1 gamma-glutamylcyclotransferase family protein [Meiothermus sp.]